MYTILPRSIMASPRTASSTQQQQVVANTAALSPRTRSCDRKKNELPKKKVPAPPVKKRRNINKRRTSSITSRRSKGHTFPVEFLLCKELFPEDLNDNVLREEQEEEEDKEEKDSFSTSTTSIMEATPDTSAYNFFPTIISSNKDIMIHSVAFSGEDARSIAPFRLTWDLGADEEATYCSCSSRTSELHSVEEDDDDTPSLVSEADSYSSSPRRNDDDWGFVAELLSEDDWLDNSLHW